MSHSPSLFRKFIISLDIIEFDWEIMSGESALPASQKIFVSDVPREIRHYNKYDRPLAKNELAQHVLQLEHLEHIVLPGTELTDVTPPEALDILEACPNLQYAAFSVDGHEYGDSREKLMMLLCLPWVLKQSGLSKWVEFAVDSSGEDDVTIPSSAAPEIAHSQADS